MSTRYTVRRDGSDANIGPTYATATESHIEILEHYFDDINVRVVAVEDERPLPAFAREMGYATWAEWAAIAGRMCVTMDGSEFRGDLYVRPDFGCVQWEKAPKEGSA